MKISTIWFDGDQIYGRDENGNEYKQSLLWYPKLYAADNEQRNRYTFGFDGIHWRNLDEDISFESFTYEDCEPSLLQRFFLTHRGINIDKIAQAVGIKVNTLRKYINGFQKPSPENENALLAYINTLN